MRGEAGEEGGSDTPLADEREREEREKEREREKETTLCLFVRYNTHAKHYWSHFHTVVKLRHMIP